MEILKQFESFINECGEIRLKSNSQMHFGIDVFFRHDDITIIFKNNSENGDYFIGIYKHLSREGREFNQLKIVESNDYFLKFKGFEIGSSSIYLEDVTLTLSMINNKFTSLKLSMSGYDMDVNYHIEQ